MNVVALLKYKENSTWMSCETINNNLTTLYSQLFSRDEVHIIEIDNKHFENFETVKTIRSINPTHLVFIDHRLSPHFILPPLKRENFDFSNIKISIHIYGHPFEKIGWWQASLAAIKDLNVQFITSSESFKAIFSKLFNSPPPIYVAPFPVDEKYKFISLVEQKQDCSLTKKLRNTYKDKTVILYTGRISPRKNIHILIEYIKKLKEKNNNILCLLVGPFDDMNPYLTNGAKGNRNTHISVISTQLEKLDPNGEFIKFIPKLDKDKLKSLYLLSDYYFSFSTMTGEDFAMSVAEAACAGLNIHLTKWAAHKDHAQRIKNLTLYPVRKIKDDCEVIIEHNQSFPKISIEDKAVYSELNYGKYSLDSIQKLYKEHTEFSNFRINKKILLWLFKDKSGFGLQDREYMEYYNELF